MRYVTVEKRNVSYYLAKFKLEIKYSFMYKAYVADE